MCYNYKITSFWTLSVTDFSKTTQSWGTESVVLLKFKAVEDGNLDTGCQKKY